MRTVAGQRFLNELNMGHLPESANINALPPNTLTNIEQDTLTAVQNDLDSIEQMSKSPMNLMRKCCIRHSLHL